MSTFIEKDLVMAGSSEEKMVINVSGQRFQTKRSTVERFGNTLLGDPVKRALFYDSQLNEYFFDRNRPSFDAILYYYQSGGQLRRNVNVPFDVFLEEIKFFELDEKTIEKYIQDEGYSSKRPVRPTMPTNGRRDKAWRLFEHPGSSLAARILAVFSALVTLLFTAAFCLETLPYLAQEHRYEEDEEGEVLVLVEKNLSVFFVIKTVCVFWFVIELLVRFVSCPNRLHFFRNPFNIVDLVVIAVFCLDIVVHIGVVAFLGVLRVLRLVRIFDVCATTSSSFRHRCDGGGGPRMIIGRTIRASLKDLGFIGFLSTICTVIFSSAVYFAERYAEHTQFYSIPYAFWWAVVTMTTVGYGDVIPVTVCGKLVGSICAVTGIILTIGLPVAVVVFNFSRFRSRDFLDGETAVENYFRNRDLHPTSGKVRPTAEEGNGLLESGGGCVSKPGVPLEMSVKTGK